MKRKLCNQLSPIDKLFVFFFFFELYACPWKWYEVYVWECVWEQMDE